MSPDSEHRGRAYQVAERAFAAPTEERRAILDRECAGQPELRAAVEALLSHDATGGEFLEVPLLGNREAERTDAWIGRTVGRFRIVGKLGEGGMSRVYLGERIDGGFRQQVAVKVLRRSMDDAEMRRRFRSEREILAGLDHPLIARVLDGGTTDDGVPYLVLEHVRGVPLTEYCDRRCLSVRERVALVRQICGAVHSAHQKLVIHRDLKPSNILVTEDGLPKLLDFGISKIVEPSQGVAGGDPTTRRQLLLTPRYASPEQLAGRPVTTATDVYTLGVILYELLSGRCPQANGRELLRQASADTDWRPPPPPSMALTGGTQPPPDGSDLTPTAAEVAAARSVGPAALRRQLAGDLDTVVLQAMRYDPGARYGSVERLSEDLYRFLVGLPVTARSPTLPYRARKFIGRHTAGVIGGATVALLLVAFSIASTLQAARVAAARDRAERQRQRAEAVTQFLVQSFELADPSGTGGETLTAREVLDRAAQRVSGDLVERPDLRAAVTRTIGEVYRGLGLFDESVDFLRQALGESRELYAENDPQVADARQQLALSLAMRGSYTEAEALARLAAETPDLDPSIHVEALDALTTTLWGQGRYEAAAVSAREALKISRAAFTAPDDRIAGSLSNLSTILSEQGQFGVAEDYAREALQMLDDLHGPEHPRVVQALNNLAMLLRDSGLPEQALPFQRQALDSARKLFGAHHPETIIDENNFALLLYDHGDYDQALSLFQDIVDAHREMLGPENRYTASALNNLALTEQALGDYAGAERSFREALAINRKVFGDENSEVAKSLQNLGFLVMERGDNAGAEQLFRRALAMQAKTAGGHGPGVASASDALGKVLVASGRYEEARRLAEQAVHIYEETLPADSWRTAIARSVLGASLAGQGDFEQAEVLLLPAYTALRKARGDRASATKWAADRLRALYEAWGKPDQAAGYLPPNEAR